MHINVADVIIGGMIVITSVIFLQHFQKQPDSSQARKFRNLSIITMILGWMIVVWDPLWVLAFSRK